MNKLNAIEEAVNALDALMARGKFMEDFHRSGKGELFILKYLFEKASPALPSELSEALRSSTARISVALGTLEKKGQIHREIDTSNRRNILVTITDAGRERIHTFMQQMRNHMICVLTEMGEKDAKEFVRLMERFFEIAQRTMPDITE
ncbi:MarR family winged helix-turn-helix transcriptional regulator [Ruminiclostridium cellobioparum]|uniref:MarR family winged helix-turn-helix transcriptional regulator n=1 Tax=Ruminiclostridium cellobioparum TaxID=29355 RepID=UPI0005943CB1|nr:transcriptional regulator [Ruminiclostridium cellobioparum]